MKNDDDMKKFILTATAAMALFTTNKAMAQQDFNYDVDRFDDIQVLRYQVPGFEDLTLNQKKYVYYLTQAALQGRDILTDQNCKYNLQVRQLLEAVYVNGKATLAADKEFLAMEKYLKHVWFANGIHHHYGCDKFVPEFSQAFFDAQVAKLADYQLPLACGQSRADFVAIMDKVIFDPAFMAKRVNQDAGDDLVLTSACNMYEGVTQKEVEDYYASIKDANDPTPISYGLNARVVKKDGKITEEHYHLGGLYSEAIGKIITWLAAAQTVAENDAQKAYISKLIEYYTTGNLRTFDEYSILWAEDTKSQVDFINGFIEDYGDPLGMTGSWEAMVNFKNLAASHRTHLISDNAQYFEDNSPVDPRFRKPEVKGVSAKVITAAILAGDSYPSTPIGINLPNADWIRAAHGSKSVTIENITDAYDEVAKGNGLSDEFAYSKAEVEWMNKYLTITDKLHTDLHECLGHASGQLLPGTSPNALGEYASALEEARADLFALYYLADSKLLELGILDNDKAYQAEYYKYIMNGLMTQLSRIEPGKNLEEAHMRNRKLVSEWCYQMGKKDKVIEYVTRKGKTYVRINNYEKLRTLFGKLLGEIQRIKSEGDYAAGKKLIETYAVKVDPKLHAEVLARYEGLNIAPYKGFVNPVYSLVTDENGNITDVKIDYTEGYIEQMLRYSRDYSPLTK